MPGLFITGTDTHVGKTYVSALITRQLRHEGRDVGVYKPVASGCVREGGILISEDALALWEAAGRPGDLNRVCPQRFAAALAPQLAARAEGREVDKKLLREGGEHWRERSDIVVVEGVGGLLSPLTDGPYYVADLAAEFGYPLVIVARNALGTINHTLLTVQVAKARGLKVVGIVLNQPSADPDDVSIASNRHELAARAGVPVLAQTSFKGTGFDAAVDWWAKAQGIAPLGKSPLSLDFWVAPERGFARQTLPFRPHTLATRGYIVEAVAWLLILMIRAPTAVRSGSL